MEKDIAQLKDQALKKHGAMRRQVDDLLKARPVDYAKLTQVDDLIGQAVVLVKDSKGRLKTWIVQIAALAKRAEAVSLDLRSETARLSSLLAAFRADLDQMHKDNSDMASYFTHMRSHGSDTH